jgi:hypothetical protein
MSSITVVMTAQNRVTRYPTVTSSTIFLRVDEDYLDGSYKLAETRGDSYLPANYRAELNEIRNMPVEPLDAK